MAFLLPAAAAATTAATAAVGSMSFSSVIGLIGTAVSTVGSIAQGMAQAQAAEIQATNALIQGKAQELNHKRTGLKLIDRTREAMSAVNASAAAGGIDPYSGSAGALSNYAQGLGFDEFNLAQENAEFARLSGEAGQAAYLAAANSYRTAAAFKGTLGLLSGFQKLSSVGGPSVQPFAAATKISALNPAPYLSGYPDTITGTMY